MAGFLSRKEYMVVIGIVISVVVMASRPAAVFIEALREHPRHKRRRALKRAAPHLFAVGFLTACLAALLGYFKVPFAIGLVLVLVMVLLRGRWILRSYGGRLPGP